MPVTLSYDYEYYERKLMKQEGVNNEPLADNRRKRDMDKIHKFALSESWTLGELRLRYQELLEVYRKYEDSEEEGRLVMLPEAQAGECNYTCARFDDGPYQCSRCLLNPQIVAGDCSYETKMMAVNFYRPRKEAETALAASKDGEQA